MKPKRHDAAREQAIYKKHVGFFELALAHFELPHDAATIAHRAALQDHAYMDDRRRQAERADKDYERLLKAQREGRRIGMFALPPSWSHGRREAGAGAPSSNEAVTETRGMFAIPRYRMVPDDGSYPPYLGATRMLDMMVEAGLVVREEPKVIETAQDADFGVRAVRYWGTEQAAISARRHEEARNRAYPSN